MKCAPRSLFLVLLILIGLNPFAAVAAQPLKLNSGKSVEILLVGPLYYAGGSKKGLALKYRTTLPMTDIVALRKEADEVWNFFQVDADHAKYDQAIIIANGSEHGVVITTSQSFNFVYEKGNGVWRTLESTNAKTLDDANVRAFFDRFDWLQDNDDMNAVLLYLDKDWTIRFEDSRDKSVDQKVLNRIQFATIEHDTLSKAQMYRHQRVITEIKIIGGTKARVISREIEDTKINGQQLHVVSDSVDDVEFDGHVMLITKSATTIVQQAQQKTD